MDLVILWGGEKYRIGYALARLVDLRPDAGLGSADQGLSPLWSMQVSGVLFSVCL